MITVKRESDLETQTWMFAYSERGHVLHLHRWERKARETKRRKFRVDGEWHVYRQTERGPIPPDVIDEARRQFVETLKVEA